MRRNHCFGYIVRTSTKREEVKFTMTVEGAYNEALERQLMERVRISNFQGESLMNRRNEMGGIRVERTQYRRWGGGQ